MPEQTSICNCTITNDFCCYGEQDSLALTVYFLTHALSHLTGGGNYTDLANLLAEYKSQVENLTDPQYAAYSMQLARCFAIGLTDETEVSRDITVSQVAANGIKNTFSTHALIELQTLLLWQIIIALECNVQT